MGKRQAFDGGLADPKEFQPRIGDGPRAKAVLEQIRLFKLKAGIARDMLKYARYDDWIEEREKAKQGTLL
jgi:hypothetical protein